MTPTLVIADLIDSVIADSIRNLCDVRMLNQVQHDAGDAT